MPSSKGPVNCKAAGWHSAVAGMIALDVAAVYMDAGMVVPRLSAARMAARMASARTAAVVAVRILAGS